MRRVVVTGMGIHSCIGYSIDEVRDSLFKGKSGIVFDPERKQLGFRSALTGKVDMPDIKGKVSRRERVGMADEGIYAYAATDQAFIQAKIDMDFLEKNEVGILYGNDSSAKAVIDAADIMREKKDTMLLGSGAIFQGMNSTVTMNLATIFKLRGINFTISGACASGSHAIGLGYLMIRSGLQEIVLCGGAQEVNHHSMASFDGLSAFSTRESEPEKACRPFDKDRDGLVPSGGAASLILESYESAVKRGVPILAEVIGYGFSSNGSHISVPNVDGPFRSLNMAIKDSGLDLRDIDYVNAHATATPVGDMNEAKAIDLAFGEHKPYVSSTKSMTGHECWMAGASEAVYSVIMMHNDFVAPNINFSQPGEEAKPLNITPVTVEMKVNTVLSNSFGFGGTNSTLILRKFVK
ncbi:MAG TPA: beta-ketoacyl-[acyl-carrier-protein] synthase family protein [bacterium]|jgi:3-oxoacyl-[acyl-carrier-protein] synthase-1|nr:beta-ketoacyl-[acyl-carrier-protein] synthase family protein [bacterium]HQJ59654.1 beta-ketoacyl-[acyl-carrier-protein] synthase family protein [bacterium]